MRNARFIVWFLACGGVLSACGGSDDASGGRAGSGGANATGGVSSTGGHAGSGGGSGGIGGSSIGGSAGNDAGDAGADHAADATGEAGDAAPDVASDTSEASSEAALDDVLDAPICDAAALLASLPQDFLNSVSTSACVPSNELINLPPVMTLSACQGACGAGTGCPLTLAWHDATLNGNDFSVLVDVTLPIDFNYSSPVISSGTCTKTGTASDVADNATITVAVSGGTLSTDASSMTLGNLALAWNGCAALDALGVDSEIANYLAALDQLVGAIILQSAHDAIAAHSCP